MRLTRRAFLVTACATTAAAHMLPGQALTPHTSVSEIERAHIEQSAHLASRNEPGRDRYPLPLFSNNVAAFAAAFLLDPRTDFGERATADLRFWPEQFPFPPKLLTRENVLDLLPHAELARAYSFVADVPSLAPLEKAAIEKHMAAGLDLLNQDPQATLARDTKDHRASAWLLLAAALARATRNDTQLNLLRLRFKKPTLRNQIAADGSFPQEVTTPNPLRNSLFNFDLLAGACQLLTSPFDNLWAYEMPEGPGLRSVAAFLTPFVVNRAHWPFVADAQGFREVPLRRPALLLAGRAYDRAEYVQAFASAPLVPMPPALAYSFPLTQPLLWTAHPPHG